METKKHNIGTLHKREVIGGILGWPMFLLGSQLLVALILWLFHRKLNSLSGLAWYNLIVTLITLGVLLPFFLPFLRQQFTWLTALRGKRTFGDLGIGIGLYFGLSFVVNLITELLIRELGITPENTNQAVVEKLVTTVPPIMILDVCLLAPLTEELLCRGLIFCGLYRHSRFWAYSLSMAVFSFAHVFAYVLDQPPLVSLINFLSYLPAGFALAWVYERSESIWASIFLHGIINSIALLLVFGMR